MIIVRLLRWIFGYVEFDVEGKFPERFINLAARKGVNIWRLRKKENNICGFSRRSEYRELEISAEKTQNNIHIVREYGLPFLVNKYKHRSGLFAGMVICAIFCKYMSGYVWDIKVEVPDMINEYEVRSMLKEYGVYEGAKRDDINVQDVISKMYAHDSRISWMTLNISGTSAQVKISPDISKAIKKNDITRTSNMKSAADGTVTRVKVKNGTAAVKAGDGIKKGQLLVSGVMEYNDGTTVIVDSKAEIFAKTARSVKLEIPKTFIKYQKNSSNIIKNDVAIFGIKLPVSFSNTPQGYTTKINEKNQLTLLGSTIPVYVLSEKWQEYEKQPAVLDKQQADKLLKNKLALYELFMISSTKSGKILRKNITVSETSDSFTLYANYEIEEDVCVRSEFEVIEPDEIESKNDDNHKSEE